MCFNLKASVRLASRKIETEWHAVLKILSERRKFVLPEKLNASLGKAIFFEKNPVSTNVGCLSILLQTIIYRKVPMRRCSKISLMSKGTQYEGIWIWWKYFIFYSQHFCDLYDAFAIFLWYTLVYFYVNQMECFVSAFFCLE